MNTLSWFYYEWCTISVLWVRELKRFWRQPSRLAGAIGQPIIFWLVLGSGMGRTFQIPGLTISYLEFFFPGVIIMVLLFTSIFSAVSVIEDRNLGFLQAVLAGPATRVSVVLGKCLGAANVALIQASIFCLLMPMAGFHVADINWLLFFLTMTVTSLGLTALGYAIAWWINNVQGYHAVHMTLMMPLWFISGALFPANVTHPVLRMLMLFNPVAHAVSMTRRALYGKPVSELVLVANGAAIEFSFLMAFSLCSLMFAIFVCIKKR